MKKRTHNGLLITLEGGEGVGKSTLINHIYETLSSKGYSVVKTREPGGSEMSEQIRALLLQKKEIHLTKTAELLLFLAARAQHVEEYIKPNLEAKKIILCDRFTDSTLAYQGSLDICEPEFLKKIAYFGALYLVPDLTLFLDLDPQEGMKRVSQCLNTDETLDRIETRKQSFHEKVREAFLAIHEREPERFKRLDASKPAAVVFEKAMEMINPLLPDAILTSR